MIDLLPSGICQKLLCKANSDLSSCKVQTVLFSVRLFLYVPFELNKRFYIEISFHDLTVLFYSIDLTFKLAKNKGSIQLRLRRRGLFLIHSSFDLGKDVRDLTFKD